MNTWASICLVSLEILFFDKQYVFPGLSFYWLVNFFKIKHNIHILAIKMFSGMRYALPLQRDIQYSCMTWPVLVDLNVRTVVEQAVVAAKYQGR